MQLQFEVPDKWKFLIITEDGPNPIPQDSLVLLEGAFRYFAGALYLLEKYFSEDDQKDMVKVVFLCCQGIGQSLQRSVVLREGSPENADAGGQQMHRFIERLIQEVNEEYSDE